MKGAIRDERRAKLSALSESDRLTAARAAAHHLVKHPVFLQSQHIGCYFSITNECDTRPLIEAIWHAQKSCYLPVLTDKKLCFAHYLPDSLLLPNKYHIPEPQSGRIKPVNELDLVIVPLVAFDQAGHRLGQGGGYYDRTFSFRREALSAPYLLGFAFSMQRVSDIPYDTWDVNLDGVLTEQEWMTVRS